MLMMKMTAKRAAPNVNPIVPASVKDLCSNFPTGIFYVKSCLILLLSVTWSMIGASVPV